METESMKRGATKPGIGGLRDALIGAFVGWVTVSVATQTGSPETGQVAGQAAGDVASQAVNQLAPFVAGGLMGIITGVRKWAQELGRT